MKKLTALLLLFPLVASAEPQPWMKKENPNTLYSSVRVGENCSITSEELGDIVHGVLIRSRIKPADDIEDLSLFVDLQCGKKGIGSKTVYTVDTEFVRAVDVGGELYWARMGPVTIHGGFGIDDDPGLDSIVKSIVEETITDYLKANFDLEAAGE